MTRPNAILFAIALGACPKASPDPTAPTSSPPADASVASADAGPPPPLDVDLPRLALLSVQLYEEIASAFSSAGKDCAAAAATLRSMQPAYLEVATANAKVLHRGGAREMRAALGPHTARMDAAARAIATSVTLAECSADRELTNAFDTLVAPP